MSQPSWPPPLLIPVPPPQPSYLSQDSPLPSTWWGRGYVLVCLTLLTPGLCKLESTWAWKGVESTLIVEIEPH